MRSQLFPHPTVLGLMIDLGISRRYVVGAAVLYLVSLDQDTMCVAHTGPSIPTSTRSSNMIGGNMVGQMCYMFDYQLQLGIVRPNGLAARQTFRTDQTRLLQIFAEWNVAGCWLGGSSGPRSIRTSLLSGSMFTRWLGTW